MDWYSYALTQVGYSQRDTCNTWYKLILQFIAELQKLQEEEFIPAPAPEMSDRELSDWLIKLQQYRMKLEQQKLSAGTVPSGRQLYFDENKLCTEATMTGEEMKAALRDEIHRLDKLQEKVFEDLRNLPETREEAITNVIYELIPAWHKLDEKCEEIDTKERRCQNRESIWEAANRGWTYQPPIEFPTWKDKGRDLIRSTDEKAWQIEGANLKEWRRRIDRAKEKHEQDRQQIQTETNAKAPQIQRQADELMAQREAIINEQNQNTALIQQMRKVYQGFPKGEEPFLISAGCDAISLMSDVNLIKQIEDRKNLEREIEKAKDKVRGAGRIK